MNCKKCKYLSIDVVGINANNEPYIYCCQKNNFRTIEATDKLGKSSSIDGNVFYTEQQYLNFTKNKRFCINKLDFSNSEFWSIILSFLAFGFSIISLYVSSQANKQNEKNNLSKTEIEKIISAKIDSTLNSYQMEHFKSTKQDSENNTSN